MNSVLDRIAEYLRNGGLFNPDIMDHDKVRDLLIDCRAALTAHGLETWVVGQCRNGAPHYCANCGNTFECLTPADDARVEALNAENDRLRSELAPHGGTVPHPDYVELGLSIASERDTWDLESYATVITIALKRAFAAGTAPAS